MPVRESLWLRPKASNIRVVIDDRHLDEVELDSYFKAVGGIILAHSNEGPSGIMGKAYMAGNRIIARRTSLMSRTRSTRDLFASG